MLKDCFTPNKAFIVVFIAISTLFLAVSADAASYPEVKIMNIHDGDTVTVLYKNGKKAKVRLLGIDAPELDQAYGDQSRRHLKLLLSRKKTITFRKNGEDMYGRYLGTIYADGVDISYKMIYDGFAWHYLKYVTSNKLAKAEADARFMNRGLWSASKPPIAPWDFRSSKRKDVYERNTPILKSPVPGIAICIDMRTGEIKHFMDRCPKNYKAIIR